ncbi:MAG: ATP-binding protein, partial [Bdellovibrionota bacterium]|nr:ATP-binding protein [Bdellovibrionota bacterium]
PTITIISKEDDNFIEVEINDNGGGIDQDVKGKIFNCGFSSKPGHLGIGLHQAFNFMIEMEGGLILKNEEDMKGATFILRFKKG